MRISDWSSVLCSSDLLEGRALACAVATKERDALTLLHTEGNALERKDDAGIGDLDVVKFQHWPICPVLGIEPGTAGAVPGRSYHFSTFGISAPMASITIFPSRTAPTLTCSPFRGKGASGVKASVGRKPRVSFVVLGAAKSAPSHRTERRP